MNRFTKIMLAVWCVLALICFISAFFAPLYFKIIGIAFGSLNLIVILSMLIGYFQGLYWDNKMNSDGLSMQEDEAETTA